MLSGETRLTGGDACYRKELLDSNGDNDILKSENPWKLLGWWCLTIRNKRGGIMSMSAEIGVVIETVNRVHY